MVRPVSIRRFEKLFVASAALAVLAILLNYGKMEEQAVPGDFLTGPDFELILNIVINLALWFSIVRRASNASKWILIALTVLGIVFLPSMYEELAEVGTSYVVLNALSIVLTVPAIALLFTRESVVWLKSRGTVSPVDPEVFS